MSLFLASHSESSEWVESFRIGAWFIMYGSFVHVSIFVVSIINKTLELAYGLWSYPVLLQFRTDVSEYFL